MQPTAMVTIREAAIQRRAKCDLIAEYARAKGLDVDWLFVNRHFAWFERWYHGGLATGYLIRRTGVKRIPPSERKVTQHVNP